MQQQVCSRPPKAWEGYFPRHPGMSGCGPIPGMGLLCLRSLPFRRPVSWYPGQGDSILRIGSNQTPQEPRNWGKAGKEQIRSSHFIYLFIWHQKLNSGPQSCQADIVLLRYISSPEAPFYTLVCILRSHNNLIPWKWLFLLLLFLNVMN